jgi:tetratricopeptide (TPR) repeat protein
VIKRIRTIWNFKNAFLRWKLRGLGVIMPLFTLRRFILRGFGRGVCSKRGLIPFMFIVLAGILVYSNTFQSSFHLDDDTIFNNPSIRSLNNISRIVEEEPQRFIGYITFALNYHFGKLNVFGYHLVNLAIHITNALLVFWLIILTLSIPAHRREDLSAHQYTIAFICSLIFIMHPLQTQAVTYIVQRLASLASLFYLLAVCCYLKARLSRKINLPAVAVGILAFGLGMFTKEIIYTMPLLMLIYEILFFNTESVGMWLRKRWLSLSIMTGVSIGFVLMKFDLATRLAPKITPADETVTWLTYLLTQFKVLVIYLKLLIIPVHQNVDHDISVSHSLLEPQTCLSLALLVFVLGGACFLARKHKFMALGIFWFFATLMIQSSLVPLEDVMFEHRLYLPMVGFAIFMTGGMFTLLRQKYVNVAVFILGALAVLYGGLTFQRNQVWENPITLWRDSVQKSPDKARPYFNLGNALRRARMPKEAIAHYNKVIQLAPHFKKAYYSRGLSYEMMGKWDEAISDFTKTLEESPLNINAHLRRASVYARKGEKEKAMDDYEAALKIQPNNPDIYIDQGTAYLDWGLLKAAAESFTKAIQLRPTDAYVYHNRAMAYFRKGRLKEALNDFNKAIALGNPSPLSFYNRAMVYQEMKKLDQAIADYSRAIQMNPKYAEAYNDRGVVFGKKGNMKKAIEDFTQAIAIHPRFKKAYANRSFAYAQVGEIQKAEEDRRKILPMMWDEQKRK